MKALATASLLLLSVLLLESIQRTECWGEEGHKIIAQLAWNRLSSRAQQVSQSLMGAKTMADIAPVPDTYRTSANGQWSAPCHYYDLPRTKNFSMDYCTGYCVMKSVTNYTQLLAADTKTVCEWGTGIEPCALSFLVHYVGDSHQPLHVSYGDDKGGNSVKVKFFTKSTNLHSVWDTYIIQRWSSDLDSAVSQLEDFISQNSDLVQQYLDAMSPEDWGSESFGYVMSTVYDFDNLVRIEKRQKEITLGQQYYDRNLPIVQQRLVAGGVRLAQLLESIL